MSAVLAIAELTAEVERLDAALAAAVAREALAMEQAGVAREEALRWRADYHVIRSAIEDGGSVERVTWGDVEPLPLEFDELVAYGVNVHIERMSDSVVWASIHDRVLHFRTQRGAHLLVSVEQDASRLQAPSEEAAR